MILDQALRNKRAFVIFAPEDWQSGRMRRS